jgi:Caspase domain
VYTVDLTRGVRKGRHAEREVYGFLVPWNLGWTMSIQTEQLATPQGGTGSPSVKNPTDCAVVVGINWYPDLDSLGGPLNDAKEFASWLIDQEPGGGGTDDRRVRLILSPAANGAAVLAPVRPVREEVLAAFDWLDDLAVENNEAGHGLRVGRRLYLYLSGHGFAPQDDQTALLMANATRQRVGYHVLGSAYADWFFHAGYFDEILLFMDCCREVYPLAPLNPPHFMPLTDPNAVNRVRLFYGYGTRWSKLSRERPMPPKNEIRGVFTSALMAGLRGAAADPGGRVTAGSLYSYLFQNMRTFLDPADQNVATIAKEPDLYVYPTPDNNWVIVDQLPPPAATVQIFSTTAGAVIQLLDGRFQPVATNQPGPPAWHFQVPPGLYLAREVAAGGMPILAEHTINLTAGGNPDVNF